MAIVGTNMHAHLQQNLVIADRKLKRVHKEDCIGSTHAVQAVAHGTQFGCAEYIYVSRAHEPLDQVQTSLPTTLASPSD